MSIRLSAACAALCIFTAAGVRAQLAPPKAVIAPPPVPATKLAGIMLSPASVKAGKAAVSVGLQGGGGKPGAICGFQISVHAEGAQSSPVFVHTGLSSGVPGQLGPFSLQFDKAGKHLVSVNSTDGPKDKCQGSASAALEVLPSVVHQAAVPGLVAAPPPPLPLPELKLPPAAPKSLPDPKLPPSGVEAPKFAPPNGIKIAKILPVKPIFEIGDTLKFSVWGEKPGTCAQLAYRLAGTDYNFSEPKTLPFEFEISAGKPGYPTAPGQHKIELLSKSIDCVGRVEDTFVMKLKAVEGAKIAGFAADNVLVEYGEDISFSVQREKPGTCAVNLVLDGKMEKREGVKFPGKVKLTPTSPLYPKPGAKVRFVLQGVLPECVGSAEATVGVKAKPTGKFGGAKIQNGKYSTIEYYAGIPLTLDLAGQGHCHVRISLVEQGTGKKWYEREVAGALPQTWRSDFNLPPYGKRHEPPKIVLDVNVQPVTGAVAKSDCAGDPWKASMLMYCGEAGYAKLKECKPFGDPSAEPAQPENNPPPAKPADPPKGPIAPGSLSGVKAPKAAGAITGMLVPGGSFAVDEPQKIQVNGSGSCGFDLRIWNTNYGGTHDKSVSLAPMMLANGALLYNGTHFATLAEGSYSASVTGKTGCAEVAQTDFKVTGPKLIKKVLGKPTLSLDQPPKSGNTYTKSKDGTIGFKVALPSKVKDEVNATCCDVEYNFKNQYGAWEVLQPSPQSDSSWSPAMKQSSWVAPKSVSGFPQSTVWRMKVRAYKYQVEFEWSDWLEFQTSQN